MKDDWNLRRVSGYQKKRLCNWRSSGGVGDEEEF